MLQKRYESVKHFKTLKSVKNNNKYKNNPY